ncbi:hypothetical protein K7432_017463, partial [Basidiobolus ranarum]
MSSLVDELTLPYHYLHKLGNSDFLYYPWWFSAHPRLTTPSSTDNFYFHTNYDWIRNTTLPSDESIWSTMSVLSQKNLVYLLTTIAKAGNSTTHTLLGDFYTSGLDLALIKKSGLSPIRSLFTQ